MQKARACLHFPQLRGPAMVAREALTVRAVPISRRNARRSNSDKLIFSFRAFWSRRRRTSCDSRNVTETLRVCSFVLGMKRCVLLPHTPCQIEFSCGVIFAMTRSAPCEIRNRPPLRSRFLLSLTGLSRPSRIKSTAGISLPRSEKCFTKKPEWVARFGSTKRKTVIR